MNCKWCNKEIANNVKFCPYCGGNLISFEPQQQSQINSQQSLVGDAVGNQTNLNVQQQFVTNNEEKVNIGLVILSIFIPIAGLIIFLVNKDKNKKTATASGLAALISFSISFILTIVAVIIFTNIANNEINGKEDYNQDFIGENNSNNDEIENNVIEQGDNENSYTSGDVGKWTDYQFISNDKLIKLPCKTTDLLSITGYEMKSSDEKSYLNSGYYTLINLYQNEKYFLHIEIINSANEAVLYRDTLTTRVMQSKYHVSSGAAVITFPGGLQAGQTITRDQIVNLLGEPSDIKNYTDDNYVSDTYSYFSDSIYTTTNYYEIKVVNGVIDEITLDHRHYE